MPLRSVALSPRLYLLCLIGIPLAGLLLPPWIVRYRLPPGVEPTMYASLIDFGFHTAERNDDVVIFGDSSVLFGVNPHLLGQDLGLKAVNLPNTLGSVTVLDDGNLQGYLQHNKPPRVIVFYFAAWNLDYRGQARDGFMFEGEEELLRRGTWKDIAAFASRHPQETLLFSGKYYLGAARTLASGSGRRQRHDEEISRGDGHVDDNAAIGDLKQPCEIPPWFLRKEADRTTRELAQRYRTSETAVLVYVAPVPACANAAELTLRSYAGLGAAPPVAMPAEEFKDDESFAHLVPAAVPAATRALERALAPLLRRAGEAGTE